ncbi:unnamed protein product [Acanthoscelides obtectus]|uniref:Uncharacterized protein n=1 Tax=Acanthoscelides obtectus TaxID=200917 RepID=A0A9P0LWC4_ACAOB|nr:unnamed protein product [Acanthoscelides obtectus]CAK1652099.1 hypothetical protein AOBTE_LOCUS17681 [Acanthoscelides obtectus]
MASPLLFDSTASTLIARGAADEDAREGAEEASSSESDSEVELDQLHVNLAPLDDPPEVAIPEAYQDDNLVWDLEDPSSDSRRETIACPPSAESRSRIHNLQLDIMDDIVQTRKVRMKMWDTSKEKVCELQPLDETGTVQSYINNVANRFLDFVCTTLAPIPSRSKRRTLELPQPSTSGTKKALSGIVCISTDRISHSLSTSATEINPCEKEQKHKDKPSISRRRGHLKDNRSNSFDISILQEKLSSIKAISIPTPSNWFTKRHQPTKSDITNKAFLLIMQTTKEKYLSKIKASAADHGKQYNNVIGNKKNDVVSLRAKTKPRIDSNTEQLNISN